MTTSESEFVRELGVFRTEAEAGIQFFYAWLTVNTVAAGDKRVHLILNEAPLFWKTLLAALQAASLIALGRVFDQNPSSHNVDRLLRIGQMNLDIFSKEALARRKRRESTNADEWLPEYLHDVYVPTASDFKRLRAYVTARRRIYDSKYRPLRNKVFAHKQISDRADIDALFAMTNVRELQQLMVFPSRLHEALWQLLYNGEKPNLRSARYSVRRMRAKPSPDHHRRKVQERLVQETERFLKGLLNRIG